MDDFLAVAEEHGLKVMLLIRAPFKESADLQIFTKELLSNCKNCSTLFSYDFMNEPLYFDPADVRTKTDAIAIVVSEETGAISVAMNREFHLRMSGEELESLLAKELK